jgi:UDP-N-acetylmuramoyl-tripeptide--D-alanyl-D-alanine ligase
MQKRWKMNIKEIAKVTNAEVFGNIDINRDVSISTDTRTIKNGDFYLPLKGTSFDGEKFISQAIEKGAVGTFVLKIMILMY